MPHLNMDKYVRKQRHITRVAFSKDTVLPPLSWTTFWRMDVCIHSFSKNWSNANSVTHIILCTGYVSEQNRLTHLFAHIVHTFLWVGLGVMRIQTITQRNKCLVFYMKSSLDGNTVEKWNEVYRGRIRVSRWEITN